jgi:phosphoenolpyruvate carboxylase
MHVTCCCYHTPAHTQVTGHQRLLETNPGLRRLIEMRNPYIDPINILQVC